MSNEKISQMPAATLPLAGTEQVPLVQGGANVQTAISNLIAAQLSTPTLVAANTNCVAGKNYQVETASGAFTMTFPVAPNQWDTILVQDTSGNAQTNNITINLNGKTFAPTGAGSLTVAVNGGWYKLQYNGTAWNETA